MAINSSQYTHTTAPILEAWLIKALRLVHSKKPSDRDKLRKLYREACENEAQVAHMTIAEALREHREAVSVSSSSEQTERDTSGVIHPTQRSRIISSVNELNVPTPSSGSTTTTTTTASTVATACVIDSTNSTPTPTTPINATTHHPNCDQVLNSVNNPPSPSPTSSVILNTPITTTGTNAATGSIPSSIQSTNRTAVKRNKVAFFNIFDIASSTASNNNNNNNSSTSTSTTSKNITIQRCLSQLDNLINNTESADSGTTIQPSNSGSCNISSHTSVGTGSINSSTSGVPTIDSPIKNLNSSIPFIDLTNDSPTKLSPSTAATTVTTTSTTDTAVATNTTPNTTTTITLPSLDDSSSKDKLSSVKIAPSGYFSTIQTSVPTPTPAVTTDPNNLLNADKDNITLSRSSNNNNNNNNARLLAASLVADLVCRICGRLSQQPQLEPDKRTMNANVLVECIQCGSLYHQLCHQPMILMSTSKQHWLCMHCCRPTTDSVSISTSVIDMTPSSSSNSTESTTTVVSSKLIRSHSIVSSSDVTIISANISTSGSPSSSSPSTDSTHHQSLIVPNPVQLSLDSSSLSTTSTAFVSSSSFSPTNPPTTVTVGARKRKPAFTSPLSGIPRKLKDEHA